jgi:hypothetical protein
VAVSAQDIPHIRPKLLVKEKDSVKTGTPLFCDKRDTSIHYVSPGTGTVKKILLGKRRSLLEVVIADTDYLAVCKGSGLRAIIGDSSSQHKRSCAQIKSTAFRFPVNEWGDLTSFYKAPDWKGLLAHMVSNLGLLQQKGQDPSIYEAAPFGNVKEAGRKIFKELHDRGVA